jgi:nitrate reductase gamma subunit
MNPFDFATLLVCFIALGFGFFYGALRTIVFAVISYICLILAGLYFQTFGDLLHLYVNINLRESHAITFLSTFLVTLLLIGMMGLYTFRSIAGGTPSTTSRVAAIAVSLLNALIIWGVVAHLYTQIAQTTPEADTITVFGGPHAVALVESSRTIKPLADAAVPMVTSVVAPFVFSDIYELFPAPTPTPQPQQP